MKCVFTGGILFSVLLELKYDSPRSKRLGGNRSSCSNSELLRKLICLTGISNPNEPSTEVTSRFKTCYANGAGNSINTLKTKKAFDQEIKSHYATLHNTVAQIIADDFITDKEYTRFITSLLVHLTVTASNIKAGDLLYTNESGIPETKSELARRDTINLPALILGLWHFTVSSLSDNRDGAVLFEALFERNGSEIGCEYELKNSVRAQSVKPYNFTCEAPQIPLNDEPADADHPEEIKIDIDPQPSFASPRSGVVFNNYGTVIDRVDGTVIINNNSGDKK